MKESIYGLIGVLVGSLATIIPQWIKFRLEDKKARREADTAEMASLLKERRRRIKEWRETLGSDRFNLDRYQIRKTRLYSEIYPFLPLQLKRDINTFTVGKSTDETTEEDAFRLKRRLLQVISDLEFEWDPATHAVLRDAAQTEIDVAEGRSGKEQPGGGS